MLLRVPTIEGAAAAQAETPTVYRPGQLGPVGIGEMTVERDWALACEDVGAHYQLHLPITGTYHLSHRGTDTWPDRRSTAVHQPGTGPLLARWSAGYRALCVTLDRTAVHDALAAVLGTPSSVQVTFGPRLNLASGHGRDWANLVFSLRRHLGASSGLLAAPLVAAPLAGGVINGFLLATSHSSSAALREPVRTAKPATVRAAVDLMEGDSQAPLTVSVLAAHCGVSVRTLQNAFRRHMGMPPLAYLREVRLRRAHLDLRAASPSEESVACVARRWGFGHLGRFAAAHEAKYGQTPQKTLRG